MECCDESCNLLLKNWCIDIISANFFIGQHEEQPLLPAATIIKCAELMAPVHPKQTLHCCFYSLHRPLAGGQARTHTKSILFLAHRLIRCRLELLSLEQISSCPLHISSTHEFAYQMGVQIRFTHSKHDSFFLNNFIVYRVLSRYRWPFKHLFCRASNAGTVYLTLGVEINCCNLNANEQAVNIYVIWW